MSAVLEPAAVEVVDIPAQAEQTEPCEPAVSGRLNIRTDRTYRFPKGTKCSKGSYLQVRADGTVTYRNPGCISDWKPGSKAFRMAALNPRTDKAGATFERLKINIDKSAAGNKPNNASRFIGRAVSDGYRIVGTDGHVALLEKRAAVNGCFVEPAEYCTVFDKAFAAARTVAIIADKEFHLALKRARIMADERAPMVRLIGLSSRLRLASQHSDLGSFDETLQVNSSEFWHVGLDIRLLEPVCGTWPLVVRYVDCETAVTFEPLDGSWKYVVMPMQTDNTYDADADKRAFSQDEEISNGTDQKPEEIAPCVEHDYAGADRADLPTCVKCGEPYPEETLPKLKYLGISYNTDEQFTHYDHILAVNEARAMELLADLRPNNLPVCALSYHDVAGILDEMSILTDEDVLKLTADTMARSTEEQS